MRLNLWLLSLAVLLLFASCNRDEDAVTNPFIVFKTGAGYTSEGDFVPVGGQLKFGISAVGDGVPITNLRVKRITATGIQTELDKGMFVSTGGIDTVLTYFKGDAEQETWNFFIMNENRDTASIVMTVYKGEGSAYGEILHFESITVGLQSNASWPHYLDLESGIAFDANTVAGLEGDIDLSAFFYFTSGNPSPTLTCPAYSSALTYYPEFAGWPVRNSTLYDYKTTDNDLISVGQFTVAQNDSLLVNGFKPENVSGLCKYCYTGKVIPFKTAAGKFGLIHVIRADLSETGSMEIAVKIQK